MVLVTVQTGIQLLSERAQSTGTALAVDNAASEQLTTQNGRKYFTLK